MTAAYSERVLRIGPFEISTGDCTISQDDKAGSTASGGSTHKVSPRSMDVLIYLMENPGRIVGSEELLDRFWSSVASDHAVHKAIAELRAAMGDNVRRQRYIKTIPKRGYKLAALMVADATVALPVVAEIPPPNFLQRLKMSFDHIDLRQWAVGISATLALGAMLLLADVETQQHRSPVIVVGVAPFLYEGHGSESGGYTGTGSESDRFLVDGLTTTLISGLAKLPELKLVSMTGFEDADSDLPKHLSPAIDHVLQGTLIQADNKIRVVVHLVRTSDGVYEYSGRFDLNSEDMLSIQDNIVSNIVNALAIHLDDERRAIMLDWGTHNAMAYERFMKGEFYNNQFNPADWEMAIEHHLDATRLDPLFINAYLGVATAANNLSVYSRIQRKYELIELVADMHRAIASIDRNHPALDAIRAIEMRMAGNDYRLEESHLRTQILSGSPPNFAIAHYALLLTSARLYDEARQFLDKAAEVGAFEISPDEIWSYRVTIVPPAEAIAMRKEQLQERPKHVGILGAVARDLVITGQYNEAIPHLARQRLADSDGVSAEFTRAVVDALRGELYPGSDSYRAIMTKGQDSFFTNGVVNFMLGDIEQGAAHWRALAAVQKRWLVNMAHVSETYFPAEVIDNEDYQNLLEELDAGKSWQRTLMEGVMILEQVTGVSLSDKAFAAYQQDRFMTRNNLWTESDWALIESNKHQLRTLTDNHAPDLSLNISVGL